MIYKFLCIGNQWLGANDGSLFRAFSRKGHLIQIIDSKNFIPTDSKEFVSKLITYCSSKILTNDFNNAIIKSLELYKPDIVCVYKGNDVYPETLEKAKKLGIPIFCIYPDVSFYDHGTLIPRLIEYYDYIFTTKSFGVNDLKRLFNFEKVSLIHHCIDPMVHKRKMEYDPFKCDVSFIGSYSLKKFNTLQKIINSREDINLKIYGNSWLIDGNRLLNSKYLFPPVHGDLYALAIYNSKINLGLLSEAGSNSAAGDLITSRSFHIPGSGGFMIHERTTDILNIFEEGESVVTFIEHEELLDLIKYYLKNDQLREKIANNASEIVWKYHKSDDRVDQIIDVLKREDLLK